MHNRYWGYAIHILCTHTYISLRVMYPMGTFYPTPNPNPNLNLLIWLTEFFGLDFQVFLPIPNTWPWITNLFCLYNGMHGRIMMQWVHIKMRFNILYTTWAFIRVCTSKYHIYLHREREKSKRYNWWKGMLWDGTNLSKGGDFLIKVKMLLFNGRRQNMVFCFFPKNMLWLVRNFVISCPFYKMPPFPFSSLILSYKGFCVNTVMYWAK